MYETLTAQGAWDRLCDLTSEAVKSGKFQARPEAFEHVARQNLELAALAIVPATGGQSVAQHLGLVVACGPATDASSALLRACERAAEEHARSSRGTA